MSGKRNLTIFHFIVKNVITENNHNMYLQETYGRYAELLHKIDSLPKSRLPEDLKSQRDFMDFVCRSFASRLERRRNVLITSQRFFRLVSEVRNRNDRIIISIKKLFFNLLLTVL